MVMQCFSKYLKPTKQGKNCCKYRSEQCASAFFPKFIIPAQRQLDICPLTGPESKSQTMTALEIDMIGGCLIEINVTSPTGLQELARFDGIHLARNVWDAIEGRR